MTVNNENVRDVHRERGKQASGVQLRQPVPGNINSDGNHNATTGGAVPDNCDVCVTGDGNCGVSGNAEIVCRTWIDDDSTVAAAVFDATAHEADGRGDDYGHPACGQAV